VVLALPWLPAAPEGGADSDPSELTIAPVASWVAFGCRSGIATPGSFGSTPALPPYGAGTGEVTGASGSFFSRRSS